MRRFEALGALVLAAVMIAVPGSPALPSAAAHDPALGGTRPARSPQPMPSTGTGAGLQPYTAPDGAQPAAADTATATSLDTLQAHYIRGQASQVYAYVNPAPGGGTLTLYVDGVATDTEPWVLGLTGLNWTPAATGSSSVSVTYSGTTGYAASTSVTATASVIPPYPSVGLTINPATVVRNHPTTLTATVTPDPGPGDVEFTVDGVVVATVALTAGTATTDASVSDVGQHMVIARFLGNADWSEQSFGAYLQVQGDGTTITFDSPTLPIAPGPLSVNVTLDPDPGTGTLQWSLSPIGQSGELPVGPGGITRIDLPSLTPADYTLWVTFPATGTWAGASSYASFKVRPATTTTLTTNRTTASIGEVAPTLKAFVTSDTCTGDTVTFLDDTGSGPRELTTMPATICDVGGMGFTYAAGSLGIGTHAIRARFNGSDTYASSTSGPVTITVGPDTAVHASFKPSASTVYASKDGYRDTVALGGTLDEKATVTIKVYTSRGSLKRTWSLGSKAIGSYGVTWNGTTKSGSKVPAGKYVAKAIVKDARGHTRTITGTVTVSWRKAKWITPTAIVKYGDQLKYYGTVGAGFYKSTDYSRGRVMDSGPMIRDCVPGAGCDDIWGTTSFQLKTGVLAYRHTTVWFDGHGFLDREHPGTFYQVDAATSHWVNPIALPDYAKLDLGFGIASRSITSTRSFRVVLYCTQAWGDAWDVHRLKVTYQYAVWR